MADELIAALSYATRLAHQLGIKIYLVEHVGCRMKEIKLMRCHKRAARERILLDEIHNFAIARGLVMQFEIDAFYNCIVQIGRAHV